MTAVIGRTSLSARMKLQERVLTRNQLSKEQRFSLPPLPSRVESRSGRLESRLAARSTGRSLDWSEFTAVQEIIKSCNGSNQLSSLVYRSSMVSLPFQLARELPRRIRVTLPRFAPFRFASSAAALKKPPPPPRDDATYDDEPIAVASGSRLSAHDDLAERYEATEDDQAAAFPAWEEMADELELSHKSREELSTNWADHHSHFDVIAEDEGTASSSRWGSVADSKEAMPSPKRIVPKRKIIPVGAVTTPLPSRETVVRPPRKPRSSSIDAQGRTKRSPVFPKRTATVLEGRLRPFVPFGEPTYDPIQPHELPLTSRHDWRLSSPLTRLHRDLKVKPPPPKLSIFSKFKDPPILPPTLRLPRPGLPNSAAQGMDKMIGVGLEPALEGNRWAGGEHEKWGWKVPVPFTEKGEWIALDEWRKGSVFVAIFV